MRRFFLLLGLLVLPFQALAADPAITTQFIRMTTSDGEEIAAFIFHPQAGMDVNSPAIVFHHGGFGGHGARTIGAPRSAAQRLAKAGYTTITLISRHVDGYLYRDIAEAKYDLAAAVAEMKRRGFRRVVLAGHSMGSLWTSIYQAEMADPIVKAMIHFAPTHDMFPLFGRKAFYQDMRAAAEAAIASGTGAFAAGPDGDVDTPPLFSTAYGRPQTAEALLNWWGEDTTNSNSALFEELAVPILMLGGRLDPVVPDGRLEQLKQIAKKSPQVDYIWYETGDHYFTGLWDQAVSDVLDWLDGQDLGVRPPVTTRLVDSTQTLVIDAGSPQARDYEINYPGTLFEPVGAQGDTLVLLLPGWKSDILHKRPVALARALAQAGQATLIPQLRANNFRGSLDASFARTRKDLEAWMVVAQEQGYRHIAFVTLGRSAFWALDYMSRNQSAVSQALLIDPPASWSEEIKTGLGEAAYAALIQQAFAREGEGRSLEAPLQAAFARADGTMERLMQYPESVLDLIGPEAKTALTDYAGTAGVTVLSNATLQMPGAQTVPQEATVEALAAQLVQRLKNAPPQPSR
ncbi:MAG: alpha/beta fold hydrolase [Pseudomonadota bacterium]